MVTLFLKSGDIPALTSFSGNIDADSLKPHIFTAQTNDIKRILGTELYDKMLADYKAGPLAGDYLTIYNDFLVPMLVYFACMYYMTFGGSKISNNGITKVSFEGATPLSETEVAKQIGVFKQLGNNNELFFYEFMDDNEVAEYNRTDADEADNNPVIPWY